MSTELRIDVGATFGTLWLAFLALTVFVLLGFAGAVSADASGPWRRGKGPILTGPDVWTAATMLGGVSVASV